MESQKKVLIVVFSNLRHDARVKRQIRFLTGKYSPTVACFDSDEMEGVRLIRMKQTPLTMFRKIASGVCLILGFYRVGHRLLHDYGMVVRRLSDESFDLIIANDVETLPFAFALSKGKNVMLDAHEYAPRHFEDRLWWRVFFKGLNVYLCKTYIPHLTGMITIGEGLAKEYERNFNIKPTVVTNATTYHPLEPGAVLPNRIRLVYHGIANPSRKIDIMIEMMKHLDERFTLDLILMTSDFAAKRTKRYIRNLHHAAESDPRVTILPPLPSHEVVGFIHKYDVGIFLLPPVNFNYANTLPNKLFEYIQARLAVAVGPTPEMAAIVRKYDNGVVADDFNPASLAGKLNALTGGDVAMLKKRSATAARNLSAENNQLIFLDAVEKAIDGLHNNARNGHPI